MKALKACATFALVLIFSAAVFAQTDSKTQQMLDEISSKTDSVTSYKVDMKMEAEIMGQSMLTEAQIAFKKPNKMHMKTETNVMGGMTQEIFTSGDIVWTYMPAMKMVMKMDMSKLEAEAPKDAGMGDNADITKPFKGFPEEKIKYLERKETDDGAVYVFEAVTGFEDEMPADMPADMPTSELLPEKLVFWISVDTGLPFKVVTLAKDGSVMTEQTYSNFRINIPIDDSEFEFTPPEGVQIMDMTEGAMNMMKQMQESQPQDE